MTTQLDQAQQPAVLAYADRAPTGFGPPQRVLRPPRKIKISFVSPIIWLLLASYAILVVYPIFWLFYSSLKSDREIFLSPFTLPTTFHWENFSNAWVEGRFQNYFANSILMTSTSVVVTTFLAAM